MIPPPPPSSIRDTRGQATSALRQRCAAMGIPTWRCDNAGLVVGEPEESGPLGLLWGSEAIARLVSGTGERWGKEEAPEIVEIFPGAWAIPLPEQRRRQRTGCLLGLALSDQGVSGPFLAEACRAAAVDAHAVRGVLRGRARYSRESAGSVREAILWMAQDLAHVEEADQTAAGFTKQLTDSFETIDLLYSLGRSMGDLARPAGFVESLCGRLKTTLGFGWVAGWFAPAGRGRVSHDLAGRTIGSGKVPAGGDFERALAEMLGATKPDAKASILAELGGRRVEGAGQVLAYPVLRSGKPVGFMLAGDKGGDDPQVSSYDIQLMEAAAGYVGAFLNNAELYAGQRALSMGVLESLTAAIDAKDTYTCGHSQRVALMSWRLALASGLNADQAERVRIGGLVHDVGKIGVPEAVLAKVGKLTPMEFEAIKKHPEIGYRILKDLPLLEDILPGVLHHHERWDGAGYPRRIGGESIPMIARIIALADTFDAMSSTRSYRAAMSRPQVLAEIQRCAGTQFDPALVRVFVGLDFAEYDGMVAEHSARERGLRAAA